MILIRNKLYTIIVSCLVIGICHREAVKVVVMVMERDDAKISGSRFISMATELK